MNNYHCVLTREAGVWIAQVFEIPGCVASGETPTQAMRALDDALAWTMSQGPHVPPPLQEDEWNAIVGKRPSDEF